MLISGKMKLRDKRVIRILEAKGLQHAEVFHGPRKIWWLIILFMLVAGCYLFPMLYTWTGWYFICFLLLYLVVGFVISGRYFNSFALTDTELIVINPNLFCRCYTAFPLAETRRVVMGSAPDRLAAFFCIPGCNYIEIGTDNDLKLYYCAGLDEHDGYGDEALTEKTLEDLGLSLERKGIRVQAEYAS